MRSEEILKMCRSLARKYNDPQEYGDLVSEGIIACLELLESGETNKNALYTRAAFIMNDYYNIKRSPVYVPIQGKAKGMSSDDDISGWTETAMHNALYGESVEIEEHTLQVPSTEDLYERKEYLEYVKKVAKKHLSDYEYQLMQMRYWDDMTQQEVAEVLQISQQAVLKREKTVLSKLSWLLNRE